MVAVIPFLLHPKQRMFCESQAPIRSFVAGRGTGKTLICCHDLLKRAKHDRMYLVGAPTYGMLEDSSYRTFLQHADRLDRLVDVKGSAGRRMATIRTFEPDKIPSFGRASVIFRTASDPERWRGPNLSGVWLDEASVMIKAALDVALACLREGGELGWMSMSFTPKGKGHWTYDTFFKRDGTRVPNTFCISASSRENPFLAEGFIDLIISQYSLDLQLQEIEGIFSEIAGIMFRAELFEIVEASPSDAKRVRYWDKAFTEGGDGAASAGVLMSRCRRTGVFFIEDIEIGRWSPANRNAVIKQTAIMDANRFGSPEAVDIFVEEEPAAGKEVNAILANELAGFPMFSDRPHGDKPERARPLQAQHEIRNVKLLNDKGRGGLERKGWNQEFLHWASVFPHGKIKDMIDAASGALLKLSLDFLRPGISNRHMALSSSQLADLEKTVAAMPEEQRKALETKRSELFKYLRGKGM